MNGLKGKRCVSAMAVQPIPAMMLMDAAARGYRDNNFHAWRSIMRSVRLSQPAILCKQDCQESDGKFTLWGSLGSVFEP
jgi:hypothetical protein